VSVTIYARGSLDQSAADIIAADQEMFAAVGQWARARGWLNPESPHGNLWWGVFTGGERFTIHRKGTSQAWLPSPHAALVWALVVEADLPPVDMGRCPSCAARGGGWEWARNEGASGPWSTATGRLEGEIQLYQSEPQPGAWVVDAAPSGHPGWQYAARPCPACAVDGKPTGRERREVARLLLDAQHHQGALLPSRVWPGATRSPFEFSGVGVVTETREPHKPGDPASIEALHVLADRLQTNPASTRERTGFDSSRSYEHAELSRRWSDLDHAARRQWREHAVGE
jgi:hypothetical protein